MKNYQSGIVSIEKDLAVRYPGLRVSHDGIVGNVATYFGQSERPLFLLRESYGDFWDIRDGHYSSQSGGGSRRFWWTMGMMCYVIEQLDRHAVPQWSEIESRPFDIHAGYVNVKKPLGSSTSDRKEIAVFAQRDVDLLRRELAICRPTVVICCGTYMDYAQALSSGVPQAWQSVPVWDAEHRWWVVDWPHLSSCAFSYRELFDQFYSLWRSR